MTAVHFRAEDGTGGGAGGRETYRYTMPRTDRCLLIGAVALNVVFSLWNFTVWCEQGSFTCLVSGHFNMAVALWVILKNRTYW